VSALHHRPELFSDLIEQRLISASSSQGSTRPCVNPDGHWPVFGASRPGARSLKRLLHSRLGDAFAKFFHHLLHRALSRQCDVSPGNRWKQRYQKNPDRKDDTKHFDSSHSLVGGEQNEKPKCYQERSGYEAENETHRAICIIAGITRPTTRAARSPKARRTCRSHWMSGSENDEALAGNQPVETRS
jgi:hypothetical protein